MHSTLPATSSMGVIYPFSSQGYLSASTPGGNFVYVCGIQDILICSFKKESGAVNVLSSVVLANVPHAPCQQTTFTAARLIKELGKQ